MPKLAVALRAGWHQALNAVVVQSVRVVDLEPEHDVAASSVLECRALVPVDAEDLLAKLDPPASCQSPGVALCPAL